MLYCGHSTQYSHLVSPCTSFTSTSIFAALYCMFVSFVIAFIHKIIIWFRCTSVVYPRAWDETKAPFTPATMSKLRSTLLPQTATMSNEFIVKFRPFDKVETNWTCSICFDFVERTKFRSTLLPKPATMLPKTATMSKQHSTLSKESCQLVAFYNVAGTLLQVWTGLLQSCLLLRQCCFDIVAGVDGA